MFYTQELNPSTGDIAFNPAAFGLNMKDLDSVTAIKNKVAVSSGMITLTAEEYRAVEHLVQSKYAGLDVGGFFDSTVIPAVDMTGKDPGLYMTQQYFGFFNGSTWRSYIGNDGKFAFQGNANNFIQWNGSVLDIRGTLRMSDGTSVEDYVTNNSPALVNSTLDSAIGKYRQWLNTGNLLPYSIPAGSSGVYLTSGGLFGLKNGVETFAINSVGDAFFRGTVGAEAFISSSAKINNASGNTIDTIDKGASRAFNALDTNNQYKKWLSSSIMSTADIPTTGVVMGSQGILGYKGGTKMFELSSITGDAYFRGNIYAESGTFTGNITSSAIITGGTFKTGETGRRIEITGNGLASFFEGNSYASFSLYGNQIVYNNSTDPMASVRQTSGYFLLGTTHYPFLNFDTLSTGTPSAIRTGILADTIYNRLKIYTGQGGFIALSARFNETLGYYSEPFGVRLYAPDDYTLVVTAQTITLGGKSLYTDGTNLYWDGTRINP